MENKATVVNYSPELIQEITDLYTAGKTPKEIGAIVDRTEKSVRGKLVNLGIYKKADKAVVASKRKDEGPSKKDHLATLKTLGFSETSLEGLKNCTKGALVQVIELVQANSTDEVEADANVA